MIIDCHCHAGKGSGLTGPWDTSAPIKDYLRRAAVAGINKTVLFSLFSADYRTANKEIADIISQNPNRFFGFACINPVKDSGRVKSIVKEAVSDLGFCGIKVHRKDGRMTREIMKAAQEYSLPVIYDIMGEPHVIELLAKEYRDVSLIIPHLGSFADDWKAQLSVLDHLERHPNVYADTSGVRRFDILKEAVKRAGAEKILFGSDGPWLHPGVELSKIYALCLPKKEEDLILSGNILNLMGSRRRI